jgi:hypothetical protein
VADVLDLVEQVRREEHCLPACCRLPRQRLELRFHERVEPHRRLVEQEDVGPGHERGDERDLLPVALGVGPGLQARVKVEAFE